MTSEHREAAYTIIGDMRVSTIFRGRDHILAFETVVFKDGKPSDTFQVARYATWAEAADGHDAMVLKVQGLKERKE